MDVQTALKCVLAAAEQHLFECATSPKKVQIQDLEYLAELGKACAVLRRDIENGNLLNMPK